MIYDVVIIGTGLAGIYTALNLNRHMKILLVTNKKIRASNSFLAQGGVAVLKDDNDFKSFVEDTLKAGHYTNNLESVETMVSLSRDVINDLIDRGVDFDKNEDEKLDYTKEGAHSKFRVLHHKDITGKEIIEKLILNLEELANVEVIEDTELLNIIKIGNKCEGGYLESEKEKFIVHAKKVVLATGGVGGLFENTTNFKHIRGDGVNICLNNNIACEKLGKIQIHPTALYTEGNNRRFLISETLRGEGAYLLNAKGERFVDELLPRDIVSNAILEELEMSGEKCVYLSFNHRGVDFVKQRFPNIYAKCKTIGYELGVEVIPVTPAQHYFIGGIKITQDGRTELENLYAVGETAFLGIHGKNRLASNSLLECLVFAKKLAQSINNEDIEQISVSKIKDIKVTIATDKTKFMEILKSEKEEFYNKWFDVEDMSNV
ncbi:MAG: L-aspartate oxidase [Sarcina sp.]